MAMSAEHGALVKICSPSPVMVKSPYEWKILKWDENLHTNEHFMNRYLVSYLSHGVLLVTSLIIGLIKKNHLKNFKSFYRLLTFLTARLSTAIYIINLKFWKKSGIADYVHAFHVYPLVFQCVCDVTMVSKYLADGDYNQDDNV